MKNRKLLLTAICLMLCASVSFGLTLAYFTDYEAAKGGGVIYLTGRTEIEEEFDENDKLVSIKNVSEDDVDMVVRILAYGEDLKYKAEKDGDWVQSPDQPNVWYYNGILKKGQSTSKLRVYVERKVDAEHPLDFEVNVLHEAQRVVYTQDSAGKNVVQAPEGWTGFPVIAADK